MKLSDFIHETLRDISIGVTKAKHEVGDLTAIAPGSLNGERVSVETEVNFDVAVTATTEEIKVKGGGVRAGAAIKVLGADLSLGADGKKEASANVHDSHVSRISFTIPMILNAGARKLSDAAKEEAEYAAMRLIELEGDE